MMNENKKGEKVQIAANIKTREIIALDYRREDTRWKGYEAVLIEQVLNSNHHYIKIKSFLGDARAYNSNENFKYLNDKRIEPIIKVKRNSISSYTRITKYRIKKCNYKQMNITNGKRKEGMWTTITDG